MNKRLGAGFAVDARMTGVAPASHTGLVRYRQQAVPFRAGAPKNAAHLKIAAAFHYSTRRDATGRAEGYERYRAAAQVRLRHTTQRVDIVA